MRHNGFEFVIPMGAHTWATGGIIHARAAIRLSAQSLASVTPMGSIMVDRESRNKAARLIDDFLSGRITNFTFQNEFPRSKDKALHAINTRLWFAYSDLSEHRLDKTSHLNEYARATFNRCILFLGTDLEYNGPENFIDVFAIFKRLLNWIRRKKVEDIPLLSWPFEDDEQLQEAVTAAGVADAQIYRSSE
jgi:hypothetical protein